MNLTNIRYLVSPVVLASRFVLEAVGCSQHDYLLADHGSFRARALDVWTLLMFRAVSMMSGV